MAFKLSNRSKGKLEGVHPDMVAVVERAIELTKVDFGVTYGVRTVEEQEKLVASGRSQTMKSKHLIQDSGYSHAVDVVHMTDLMSYGKLMCMMILLMHLKQPPKN